jgi:hypothetical protein
MRKKKDDPTPPCDERPDPPPLPPLPPHHPLDFDDFVDYLRDKPGYARKIHRMVMYGRKWGHCPGVCKKVMDLLNTHVLILPVTDELSIDPKIDSGSTSRCSNNTKFYMLDFAKYK